jgi:cGMP-dependent protein kinase 1
MKDMLNMEITFPSYVKDASAKTLVAQFLDKTPACRLGGSYTTLKQHPFFNHFNWVLSTQYKKDLLLERKKAAPFVPNTDLYTKKEIDT